MLTRLANNQSSAAILQRVISVQAGSTANVGTAIAIDESVVEPRLEGDPISSPRYQAARHSNRVIKLNCSTNEATALFYLHGATWVVNVYKCGNLWRSQGGRVPGGNVGVLTPRSSWSVPSWSLWAEPVSKDGVIADTRDEIAQMTSMMLSGAAVPISMNLRRIADLAAEKCARPQTRDISVWARRLADETGEAVD